MELRGVRVHNLKNIDLDIPLERLVVVSGVSGSGKSSLAFDTLYAEGQRRYVESFSISARQHLERIDRPDADRIAHVPPAIAVRTDRIARHRTDARQTVATTGDLLDGFRLLFARIGRIICPGCHQEVRSHTSRDVLRAISELPAGTRCQLGFTAQPEAAAVSSTRFDDIAAIWRARGFTRALRGNATHDLATTSSWPSGEQVKLIVDRVVGGKTSLERITESADVSFREGKGHCWLMIETDEPAGSSANIQIVDGRQWKYVPFHRQLVCTSCERQFLPVEPRLFSYLAAGACVSCLGTGIDPAKPALGSPCPACQGTRFREEARAVFVANQSISDICSGTIPQARTFIRELDDSMSSDDKQLTHLIRQDLAYRLQSVSELGLDYLTLNRTTSTLSGGETRRLMLAAVIGARTTGTLVVVDEPSAGLSPAEVPSVIQGLHRVRQLGNSVIAVDHSPDVVAAAEHVIELGPGAGPAGGEVVYQGPPKSDFPTADINQVEEQRGRKLDSKQTLRVTHAQLPFLSGGNYDFIRAGMNVVSGPSGSGKTTLLTKVLYPALSRRLNPDAAAVVADLGACDIEGFDEIKDVILIDQSPLTKSSRSNPATWLDVFDEIRQTFAATLDAKQKGLTPQSFSFNSSSGGRCLSCLGTGLLKHDMQFLPDLTLTCPECGGTRFRREILDVKYRGRSIADVLAMSASEAAVFFRSQPRVQYRFQLLKQIGLDYLVLGQPSQTLSGGEAQRLKLAARLATPGQGPSLIICDEPTTGLHPADLAPLIECFREMIANGHTLILADNNPALLSAADWQIELGHRDEAVRPPEKKRRTRRSQP